jgi:hypothetical protein
MAEEQKKKWERKFGALWRKISPSGVEFYSGVLEILVDGEQKRVNVVAFPNLEKKHDKMPDIEILLNQNEDMAIIGKKASPQEAKAPSKPKAKPAPKEEEDEIPF